MNFTTIPGTDLSKGILESIDMDSYRFEKKAVVQIELAGENAEIDPVPSSGGGEIPEPEIDLLSNIIKGIQRSVREDPVDRQGQDCGRHYGGDTGQGGGGS